MPSSKITYAFYSAGGHARETRRGFLDGLAAGSGSDAEVVFIDDDPALYQLRIHGSYVISYEEALRRPGLRINVAFGPPALRRRKFEQCQRDGLAFFDAVAPTAIVGDKVRVVDGPFVECLGLFEGMSDAERVTILLELLGRKVRVLLNTDFIVAA